jgi:hypothetical protein
MAMNLSMIPANSIQSFTNAKKNGNKPSQRKNSVEAVLGN